MQEISPVRPANKTLTMIVLVMAFIYNVVFGFLRDPAGTDNTLSWLGYDYPHGFLLWGALTAAAYFLNLLYLYTKFGCRNRTGAGMAYTALLIAPVVVFINDWGWEQWVHLVATILFVACNALSMLLFFFGRARRKNKRFLALGVLGVLVIAGMLVVQFTLGKSGLMELVPLWFGMGVLFLANFTPFLPPLPPDPSREKRPASQKTALRLGCTCGFVGAHNFYLHRPLPAAGQALLFEVGLLFCLIPVTGVGRVNGVAGADARVFLAAGFSMLGGVLLWAGHDVLELRSRLEENSGAQNAE